MTGSLNETPAAGPRELFERWQRMVLGNDADTLGELSSADVILETPFAPPGHPRRIEGREQFLAFARPRRPALPARFEEFRNVIIHDTGDPDVIVAEYELAGTVTTTGMRASAPFIVVLTAREGEIIRWREYQDTLGMAISLGQLPALLASVS